MAKVNFKKSDPVVIERELKAQPTYPAFLRFVARYAAEAVQEVSPVHTGYYRRHVGYDGATITSSDPFAHLVEWGSVNNPPYAPMRRGILAAGLRLDQSQVP